MKGPLEEFEGAYEAIDWDENKRRANIEKHRIDFIDVVRFFFTGSRGYRRSDNREDEFGIEERWQAFGPFPELELLSVVYTEREEGSLCWMISARPAHWKERELYYAIQARQSS